MIALQAFLVLPALAGGAAPASAGEPTYEWSAPSFFVQGTPYRVALKVQGPAEETEIDAWSLTPAGFEVNGKPLRERSGGAKLLLTPNQTMTLELDLAPYVATAPGFEGKSFQLKYVHDGGEPMQVQYGEAAEKGLDFMQMPVEKLSSYLVLLSTNRGDMVCEFWPDVAPNHVRNFLDLAYTGFYDGTIFHRVIPNFMIQGGDPTGTGMGDGPRKLKAEFSDRKHVRGVLSMARGNSPDSASCQFFIMHAAYPSLDGKYSAFGKLVSGLDVLDKIVNAPRNNQDNRPYEKQVIEHAIVLKRPAGQSGGNPD
jgi:peptidyl-prolyl cis-trans isomerase B (cyclophilin B)